MDDHFPADAQVATMRIDHVKGEAQYIDQEYFKLEGEQSLPLEFALPDPAEGNHTYFLAGTGYYHQPAVSQNNPDFPRLISYQKLGTLQSFSIKETEKMERSIVVSDLH